MNEKDAEELRLRAEQLERADDGAIQMPTHVGRTPTKEGLTEREQKIWETYLILLSSNPARNNLEGVQWAADTVDAFANWVTQKRGAK